MHKGLIAFAIVASLLLPCISQAQEVEVSTGFIFYAGKYTLDEETFGVYADGHEFETLLKEVPAALDAFHSFETWHTMGSVFTSLSLVAFMFGGVAYMPGVKDSLPDNIGLYGFAAGGGLLVLGFVFEFVSWSSIGKAADLYNKDMEVDDGPAMRINPLPVPLLAVSEDGANLALSWSF